MREAPFYVLYRRYACIPTETVYDYKRSPNVIDTDDYKEELVQNLSEACIGLKKEFPLLADPYDLCKTNGVGSTIITFPLTRN